MTLKGRSKTTARLCNIDELLETGQEWYNTYPLIAFGYRSGYSLKQLLYSIRSPNHNEFGNVYSELIPSIVYLYICFSWMINNYSYFNSDNFVQWIILLCLPLPGWRGFISAYVHLTHPMNHEYCHKAWNCDYTSIISQCTANGVLYLTCMLYFYNSVWFFRLLICLLTIEAVFILSVLYLSNENKRDTGLVLSLAIGIGNYLVLFIHYGLCLADIFTTGNASGSGSNYNYNYNYRSQISDNFTFYWTLGSLNMIIASFARIGQYPEKYFVKTTLQRVCKRNYKKLQNIVQRFESILFDHDANNSRNLKHNHSKNEVVDIVIDKLIEFELDGYFIGKEKQQFRIRMYKMICKELVRNDSVSVKGSWYYAFKYWYICLVPSHTLWHIFVELMHFCMLYAWIDGFEMHIRV